MTTLSVEGMTCEGCEDIVENALSAVDGVDGVDVDRGEGAATVEGDAGTDDLVQAVDFAGYEASAE